MSEGTLLLISIRGRWSCPTSWRNAVIIPYVTAPVLIPKTPQMKAIACPADIESAIIILDMMLNLTLLISLPYSVSWRSTSEEVLLSA